jgi:hypothetical protein
MINGEGYDENGYDLLGFDRNGRNKEGRTYCRRRTERATSYIGTASPSAILAEASRWRWALPLCKEC